MGLIFSADGLLTPQDSKTQCYHTFSVSPETSRLEIHFEYHPKEMTDIENGKCIIEDAFEHYWGSREQPQLFWKKYWPVRNLLTFSIDSPQGFRGCVHRGASDQRLFIGEEDATNGLIPGSIIEGVWMAVISVHSVVTTECHYTLEIRG